MISTVNTEELYKKLFEKLKDSGWKDFLQPRFDQNQFEEILKYLIQDVADGNRLSVPIKLIFKAFEECPLDQLKVVIVGTEPYNNANANDGLAFSVSSINDQNLWSAPGSNYLMPIRMLLNAVKNECYYYNDPLSYVPIPSLVRWANQGVLLLNTSLTGRHGEFGAHNPYWKEFIEMTIQSINLIPKKIIWCFMGSQPKGFSDLVTNSEHNIFIRDCPHDCTRKKITWKSKDFFIDANNLLYKHDGSEIHW